MNYLKQKFGKRIRELRKSKGYTQEQVAEMIGMEPPNISKMENGLHFPQPENIEKLSGVFNVEIRELFSFEHFQTQQILIKHINDYLKNTDLKNVEFVYKFINNLKDYR